MHDVIHMIAHQLNQWKRIVWSEIEHSAGPSIHPSKLKTISKPPTRTHPTYSNKWNDSWYTFTMPARAKPARKQAVKRKIQEIEEPKKVATNFANMKISSKLMLWNRFEALNAEFSFFLFTSGLQVPLRTRCRPTPQRCQDRRHPRLDDYLASKSFRKQVFDFVVKSTQS